MGNGSSSTHPHLTELLGGRALILSHDNVTDDDDDDDDDHDANVDRIHQDSSCLVLTLLITRRALLHCRRRGRRRGKGAINLRVHEWLFPMGEYGSARETLTSPRAQYPAAIMRSFIILHRGAAE